MCLAIAGLVASSSCAERNRADCKWIRNKKRNLLCIDKMDKLVKVHPQLVLNEHVESKAWRDELGSWSEHDRIIESNHKIDMAMSMKVMEFINYIEPWEMKKLTLNNEESYFAFLKKYKHLCLHDNDNSEIRRIVDVEWHAPRGATANFQVVSQLIAGESPDESYEAYAITNILNEMIRDCPPPHNDGLL